MMKRRLGKSLVFAAVMGACFTAGAYAEDAIQKVEAYLRPDFHVRLNGDPVPMTDPPLIYNGSSYLPLKATGALLDAQVSWDERTQSILITQNRPAVGTPGPGQVPGQPGGTPGAQGLKLTYAVLYDLDYESNTYPALAVLANDTSYLRWVDVQMMPFDMSGVKLVTEKFTGDSYVSVDQVLASWQGKVMMKNRTTPIFPATITAGQQKALEPYTMFGALAVTQRSDKEFFILSQQVDRKFIGYTILLKNFNNDDTWIVDNVKQSYLTD